MRRLLFVLLIAVQAALGVAQERIASRMTIGAHGGMTMSRVQFNPSVQQAFLPGMIIGVHWRYVEEKHFGLIAELNLAQHGWKERYDDDDGDLRYNRRFTYLELPIMTHIYFGSERARGFFNLGPQVGFMIGKSTSANFDCENLPDDYPANRQVAQLTLPVKRKVDYGITAGIGLEVNVASRHAVSLEGRFYYGLRDVFANRKSDVFAASSSLSIAVTLGYSFALK